MSDTSNNRYLALLDACKGLHVAVVGDVMLDRYLVGKVDRISPEAPVPVVDVRDDYVVLGGAANVLQNLASLGVIAEPFGVVGDDPDGNTLRGLLKEFGCPEDGLMVSADRPTTVKTRILAGAHHVVRFDREKRSEIPAALAHAMIEKLRERIQRNALKAIILQDYNKGVLTAEVIRAVIELAREARIPVLVDPKQQNFFEYTDVTVFKPNLRELATALNQTLSSDDSIVQAASELRERIRAEYVLLTRGAQGMTLCSGDEMVTIPTQARKVSDVSGAGDTVIAVFAAILAAGGSALEAAKVSNCAAGIVVGEVGAVPVPLPDLQAAVVEL